MSYRTSFEFSCVTVIQSLPSREFATGERLFSSVLQTVGTAHGIQSQLDVVRSRPEFDAALRRLLKLASDGHSPILHLEMHGDESGLQLANGEVVGWSALLEPLQELNRIMRMNLLIVAAACKGWHLSEILVPTTRSPAWAIIGPPENAKGAEILEATSSFYTALFTGQDFDAALQAMNASDDIANWAYRFQMADLLFCLVFRHYVNSFSQEESREERVSRLVAEFARNTTVDVIETMKFRQIATEKLNDDKFWYNLYKQKFLMLDLYPENTVRFGLQFSDCSSDRPIFTS